LTLRHCASSSESPAALHWHWHRDSSLAQWHHGSESRLAAGPSVARAAAAPSLRTVTFSNLTRNVNHRPGESVRVDTEAASAVARARAGFRVNCNQCPAARRTSPGHGHGSALAAACRRRAAGRARTAEAGPRPAAPRLGAARADRSLPPARPGTVTGSRVTGTAGHSGTPTRSRTAVDSESRVRDGHGLISSAASDS
jgi:hypothetical protein